MKSIELTPKKPTKAGFYWWTNRGEHTPCVLEVTKQGSTLIAENDEYSFRIKDSEENEFWGEIPLPSINGKIIKPMSY